MKCDSCSHSVGTPSKIRKIKKKVPKTPKYSKPVKLGKPDGSSAWVVAFAAFIINFIMAGLSRMSGILYVAFIDMFHTDRKGASMPFSVRSSVMNLLGPVVGILGQKYSVRWVSIVGGVLGTVSAAACFFVDDIGWITFIWGGINGAGTALVTTLTTVVVSQYFDVHRTTASGMSFSGACIGSFIFPPLMEELLNFYGLGGSFLIIAGITMHTIPAAMILRKPMWVKAANRKAKRDIESAKDGKLEKTSTKDESHSDVDILFLKSNSDKVVELLSINNDEKRIVPSEKEILREIEDVYASIEKPPATLKTSPLPPKSKTKLVWLNSPNKQLSRTTSLLNTKDMSDVHPQITRIKTVMATPEAKLPRNQPYILSKLKELYNKSEIQIVSHFKEKTYARVLKELKKLHKVHEAIRRRNAFSPAKITPRKKAQKNKVHKAQKEESNSFWDSIKNSMLLHTNPMFLLIAICRAVHFTTFIPAITIIVDYAMDKGMMEEEGKYVIACLSIGDLIGRLGLGWVTDRGFITMPKYMLLAMVIQGAFTSIMPLVNTKLTLLPAITVYAALQGSVFVRHTVLISKYMKKNEQSIAMGCVNFFAGIFGFAVPYYVGYFRDTIGSYDGVFYLNGAIGAVAGLIWIFEPQFVKMTSDPLPEEPKV